jgi:malate dehydrogenase (oxaloacetate-decarboxylating)
LDEAEARRRFWFVDVDGLLTTARTSLTPEQQRYAQPVTAVSSLAAVVHQLDRPILIGLSTAAGAFTEPIVRELALKMERPIILPLSNPTDRSEARPEDLIRWTGGRAIVATGSPFEPVNYNGRLVPIAQCNNVYIFPAIGLGLVASRARRVTDSMILAAARSLADHSPARTNPSAALLPALPDLRRVVIEVAIAIGQEAQRAGVAPVSTPEELRARVVAGQWTPAYELA